MGWNLKVTTRYRYSLKKAAIRGSEGFWFEQVRQTAMLSTNNSTACPDHDDPQSLMDTNKTQNSFK